LLDTFHEETGFQDDRGSTLIALNAGLMKPREGFTMVTGNKNWGWASDHGPLTVIVVKDILKT
jgi:hypothetical protein